MAHSIGKAAVSTLGVAAAAGVAAFAYGALVERKAFTVRHETLPVLDPGARPLTVLHLSDLHMAPWQVDKQEWVRSLTVYEPDLIVNTGDNLGHVEGLAGVEYALEPFRNVPGVFVYGSNDYYGPTPKNPLKYFMAPSSHAPKQAKLDVEGLTSFFEDSLGWLDLNNLSRAMLIKGSRLEFFGTNDAHRQWDRLDRLPGAIDEMRENVAWVDDTAGPDVVSIGVTHAPYQRVLDAFVTYGADVIFAGHTHGGQVRVPGFPALVTNCDIPRDQAQGLSLWNHAQRTAYLNVSAGLGTSIYAPVRFAVPPEAVVVTLTARDISYS
ncbi:metallophosphoesterase [Glaciihabitans sp. dw_435]|uniref:metallophosphoesterase n=1 Tax=Glaciihabitans sp. dw_435 TaxID=2720081 RepID=UPI001BD26369|nr:metallophosphoesterase [Glaciihabitans sp. dw_435]